MKTCGECAWIEYRNESTGNAVCRRVAWEVGMQYGVGCVKADWRACPAFEPIPAPEGTP